MTQHGDAPDQDKAEGLPEVEAELVRETAPAAHAFEDDAAADQAAADADAGDAADKGLTPPRKSTLTPGVVLFLGFTLVALIAFGVWRFQQRPADAPEPAPAAQESTPTGQAAQTPETGSPPAETATEAREAKIDNLDVDNLKRAPVTEDEPPGAGNLPPVGDASKISNSVEEGAKEAMRRFQEAEAAKAAGAEAPPTDEIVIDAPQFERELSPSTDPVAPQADPSGETVSPPAAPTPEQAATAPVFDGLANAAAADAAANAAAQFEAAKGDFDRERAGFEAALAEARQRSDEQENEIAQLRAALEEAQQRDQAAAEELNALRASLEQRRTVDVQQSSRQMRASFALAALSRAIDQGEPYTEELAVMAEFIPEAQGALGAHAETGVASEAVLRQRFNAAARAALAAAAQEKAGGGLAGLMARAQSVVSVRPASPSSGDDPASILSRADHALEQGEVAFALLQLEDLPLVAQEAMADWIDGARTRAEAESALSALAVRITGDAD